LVHREYLAKKTSFKLKRDQIKLFQPNASKHGSPSKVYPNSLYGCLYKFRFDKIGCAASQPSSTSLDLLNDFTTCLSFFLKKKVTTCLDRFPFSLWCLTAQQQISTVVVHRNTTEPDQRNPVSPDCNPLQDMPLHMLPPSRKTCNSSTISYFSILCLTNYRQKTINIYNIK
jgi:hypothetical protein